MRSARRTALPMLTATLAVVGWAVASPAAPAGAAATPTTLRTDGIGPLRLGMTRTAAVRSGWLSHRGTGCPLGGTPLPITYELDGAKAPKALTGSIEFDGGKLTSMSFSRGVRTTAGVTIGTTSAKMVSAYRAAGYTAKRDPSETFGGTFVNVTKGGTPVIAGFAAGKSGRIGQLAIPAVAVCE